MNSSRFDWYEILWPVELLLLVGLLAVTGCQRVKPVAQQTPNALDSETESEWITDSDSVPPPPVPLWINEVMSKNGGAVLDEQLETEDFVELFNPGAEPVWLGNYTISDGANEGALPGLMLSPGEVVLLFADNDGAAGKMHLPFKVSSKGETLFLMDQFDRVVDQLVVPPLSENDAYARIPQLGEVFSVCRYPTAGKVNGDKCAPPLPPSLDDEPFAPYAYQAPTPAGPVYLNEVFFGASPFVELGRLPGGAKVDGLVVAVAAHHPGEPWPQMDQGEAIVLGGDTVAEGAWTVVDLTGAVPQSLSDDPLFEGVVTLYRQSDGAVLDRIDFMHWPTGASLARDEDDPAVWRFCIGHSRGEMNRCDPVLERPVGNRLRHLFTPGDFSALAAGTAKQGVAQVKVVVDLESGGVVHLLGSAAWDLHYTFVREVIDGEPHLDRCDPVQAEVFNEGWYQFSVVNYFNISGRRFLLSVLSHYGGAERYALEYTFGDAITPVQMRDGFFAAVVHTLNPSLWALHPQDDAQVEKARQIEGTLPIMGKNAPFNGLTFQSLTEGVGYGTLTYFEPDELAVSHPGQRTIVVTSDVPNDIPFVGGLITEAFQTPLAHVNILSQGRNTPNMALTDARNDERIKTYLGQLVKLTVMPDRFLIEPATIAEATDFWEKQMPKGDKQVPALDLSDDGLVSLGTQVGLEAKGRIGLKAAQLSELFRVTNWNPYCAGGPPLPLPENPFAIPVSFYMDHFQKSGARAIYLEAVKDEQFLTNAAFTAQTLSSIRQAIWDEPVNDALVELVTNEVESRFGHRRVRFRSSSNVEDLANFNGAGLYTSVSVQLNDPDRGVEDAIHLVWASLWNDRAFDERVFANIDESMVAMGILVNPAFLSEKANGVAVSRDVTDRNRGDRYYVNVQAGEATVTNPAPGVVSEQFWYQWPSRTPTVRYLSRSSLVEGDVLEWTPFENGVDIYYRGEVDGEIRQLMCALDAVHQHFRPLIDPDETNPYFAMEVEFKLVGDQRELVFKQARPYSFGQVETFLDCRSL